MEEVLFSSKPQLNSPSLIAAWPGVGQVALKGMRYLREGLGAVEFARLNPLPYFDLAGVFIENNLIQPPRFPQNIFYHWQDPQGVNDLIIFEGEAQPSLRGYELAHRVLDIVGEFGVRRVFTLAAALVPELSPKPRVWAAATDSHECEGLLRYGVLLKGDFYVTGMNGILLAVAKDRGLEAVCLLGETLRFFPQRENPAASLAILEVLTQLLSLPIDLSSLRQEAREAQQELAKLLMETRKEFIDRFTFPLWEKGDEEEKA